MAIIRHIKSAYAKIKAQPREQRWEYFWEYYKWPAIGIVLAIALLISGITGAVNRKETVFSGVLLNCKLGVDNEGFLQGFYDYAGIDSSTQTAAFYTDMSFFDGQAQNNATTFQRIMAGISIGDTDFIAGKADAFKQCAYNSSNILADLRTLLSEEQLTALSHRLYYIDGAVRDQINAPVGEHVEPGLLKYPDPHKPETMEDPIPVGIDISDCKAFTESYYLPGTTVYWGIVPNTPHGELSLKMLHYLLTQQ